MVGTPFNRSSICMRPGSHMQCANNCLCPLLFCFFGGVAFPSILYHCRFLFLYGKHVVRSPSDGVFLPCDHELDDDISLCENSIDQRGLQNHTRTLCVERRQLQVKLSRCFILIYHLFFVACPTCSRPIICKTLKTLPTFQNMFIYVHISRGENPSDFTCLDEAESKPRLKYRTRCSMELALLTLP